MPGLLYLELQAAVSPLTQVLRIKLRSSARTAIVTTEFSLEPPELLDTTYKNEWITK